MKNGNRSTWINGLVFLAVFIFGQLISFALAPASWQSFASRLTTILSMVAFWGPIVAMIAAAFVMLTLRLLGFHSLSEIRAESVEQNNPTPAIIFVGALIASLLFLMIVIRP